MSAEALGIKGDGPDGKLSLPQMIEYASKLKSAKMQTLRRRFEEWPAYLQHTLFPRPDDPIQEMRAAASLVERLEYAQELKEEGNTCFRNKDYVNAFLRYQRAAELFVWVDNKNIEDLRHRGVLDEDISLKAVVSLAISDKLRLEVVEGAVPSHGAGGGENPVLVPEGDWQDPQVVVDSSIPLNLSGADVAASLDDDDGVAGAEGDSGKQAAASASSSKASSAVKEEEDPEERRALLRQIRQQLSAVYCNMSTCSLQLSERALTRLTGIPSAKPQKVAKDAAQDALRVNPLSAKGWFRRAQVRLHGGAAGTMELEESLDELELASRIAPGNKAIVAERDRVRALLAKTRTKATKSMGGFLRKKGVRLGGDDDDDDDDATIGEDGGPAGSTTAKGGSPAADEEGEEDPEVALAKAQYEDAQQRTQLRRLAPLVQSLQKEKKYAEAEELTQYINETLRRLDLRMNAVKAAQQQAKTGGASGAAGNQDDSSAAQAAESAGAAGREAARLVRDRMKKRQERRSRKGGAREALEEILGGAKGKDKDHGPADAPSSSLFDRLDEIDGSMGAGGKGSGSGSGAASAASAASGQGQGGLAAGLRAIDIEHPSDQMREIARQQGIDLDDPRVKQLLREQIAKHTGGQPGDQAEGEFPSGEAQARAGGSDAGDEGPEDTDESGQEPPKLDELLDRIRTGDFDRLKRLLLELDETASSEAVARMDVKAVRERLEELVRRDYERQENEAAGTGDKLIFGLSQTQVLVYAAGFLFMLWRLYSLGVFHWVFGIEPGEDSEMPFAMGAEALARRRAEKSVRAASAAAGAFGGGHGGFGRGSGAGAGAGAVDGDGDDEFSMGSSSSDWLEDGDEVATAEVLPDGTARGLGGGM